MIHPTAEVQTKSIGKETAVSYTHLDAADE